MIIQYCYGTWTPKPSWEHSPAIKVGLLRSPSRLTALPSPRGSLDQTRKLWNLATLLEMVSFSQRQVSMGPVLAFSPDNQLLDYGECGFNESCAPREAMRR